MIIATNIVAVARVSASHQYTVCAALESAENKLGIYPPGTRHPYNADIGRVSKAV